jgi:hypothetical protein
MQRKRVGIIGYENVNSRESPPSTSGAGNPLFLLLPKIARGRGDA